MNKKSRSEWFPILLLLAWPVVVQAQYLFTTNSDNTITITGYTGAGGIVTIPGVTNGLPVSNIGAGAFTNKGLSSVTIPTSVTNIGYGAFASNSPISIVTIPYNVISIGDCAFYDCTSLGVFDFKGNAPSLGGTNVFTYDSNPNIFYLQGTTGWGTNFGGRTTFVQTQWSFTSNNVAITITSYVGSDNDVRIPAALNGLPVTSIGTSAFLDKTVTSVTIPDSVVNIGNDAFYQCTSLAGITIPAGVTNIGTYAFYDCTSLTGITIPGSVTNLGAYAFYDCTKLTNVYFQGNAPVGGSTLFIGDTKAIIYYLPGTTGWGLFTGPTPVLWNPHVPGSANFGVLSNRFGFAIAGTANINIVVESSASLVNPVWTLLTNLTLASGSAYFSDATWTNRPAGFYRFRAP